MDTEAQRNDSQAKAPNVFAFQNYRSFLKAWYEWAKDDNPLVISFRYLSMKAGFSSPNFFKLLMDGERNLSADSVEKVAKALRLTPPEERYFRELVGFTQAKNSKEKLAYAEKLLVLKPLQNAEKAAPDQYRYWSKWYYCPIREMVSLPAFQENPEWIARQLKPAITRLEAEEALVALLDMGLLVRDESGKLQQKDPFFTSGDLLFSAFLANFHKLMMTKGAESIDLFPAEQRDLGGITMTLSKDNFLIAKKMLVQTRREILNLSTTEVGNEEVYQLSYQFFPLTVLGSES